MDSSRVTDPLLFIERQAKQLQQDMQRYLDAQSEGLLVGLSGGLPEDTSSNGSRTPTPSTASPRHGRAIPIPVRQPPKRKIGLRGARRGITRAIQDFQRLKEEEHRILDSQLDERAAALQKVDDFVSKRQGLQKEIGAIHNHEENQRVQELKSEARDVQAEIEELETRLLELRSRHRYLSAEASKLENAVQAKLSSYMVSLSLLDTEERRFLRRPSIQIPLPTYETSALASLSTNRRTLDLTKEHWRNEEDEIQTRKDNVELERDALRDGGVVWQDVANEVTTFETMLREQMQKLGSKDKAMDGENDGGLRSILKQMDDLVEHLEAQFNLAEEQDWKLLVVAIGTELEAFKEGRRVLQEALGVSTESVGSGADDEPTADGSENGGIAPRDLLGGQELVDAGPAEILGGTSAGLTREFSARSDEEDDEPDPDLLISHQD